MGQKSSQSKSAIFARNSSSNAYEWPGICSRRMLEGEGECPSHPLCRVQPIVFHQSRAPVYSPSLNDPCTRRLSQPTTSPHRLALTLSRSTRSHTVSLYLVLTLSHVRFRTSCHMISSSVNVSHRLALIRIHLTVCRATGEFNAPTEPRTVRRTIQRTGNTHCCCSDCCCTHSVAPTAAALLMHHIAHRSSHFDTACVLSVLIAACVLLSALIAACVLSALIAACVLSVLIAACVLLSALIQPVY